MPGHFKLGVIGGTGVGALLSSLAPGEPVRHEVVTPFGRPSAPVLESEVDGLSVLVLPRHGEGHRNNPTQVPYRANVMALKMLGVTHLLATGAVGSLREEIRPRELVLVDSFIDRTHQRSGTFFDSAAVHVDFAEPTCPVLRQLALEAAGGLEGVKVHERGTYVCMEGPSFSTRAESLMHRLLGGDVIGMTALPEARLAREAEMGYLLIALATDWDCWKPHAAGTTPQSLLQEIISNVQSASASAMRLLEATVRLAASRAETLGTSPALTALDHALWTDRTAIPPHEVERLRPLWGRLFA
ncbi:MAG: MTAP family purine nucleoside phosphorylase [Tepidisphaerales bacterium]